MELQSSTKKPEAGLQPASLPSNSASATGLILLGGAFLATFVAGLTQLFSPGLDKELLSFLRLIGPGASQLITAAMLMLYKRSAKRKFRAYAEYKMKDVDIRISRLPKRPAAEYREQLQKLEDRRRYWEDLLDKNEFTYIDAD